MKITVITATYNSERTIQRSINSFITQNYKKKELIMIDGESSDQTLNILSKNKKNINVIISEKDRGIYDALNKGIKKASGEIICFLHSDDFYSSPQVLSNVVDIFKKNPETQVVIGNSSYFRKNNEEKISRLYSSSNFQIWMMRFGFMPSHPATFIKKQIYDRYGLFDINYKSAADFEFFLRIFWRNNLNYIFYDHPVLRMSEGGKSSSGIKSYIVTTYEIRKALREHNIFSGYLLILLRLPIKYFKKLFTQF